MGGPCCGFVLDAGIAQGRKIDTFEQALTGAEQDWRDGDVHLIDQAEAKILLNDVDSATNANIFVSGRFPGSFKSHGSTFRHKVEGCSSFHDQRRARVVGQHEHRDVINRILAPPTPPALIWPGSANRSEHVPAENPGPDILKASSGKFIINPRFSSIVTEQVLLKRSSEDSPAMKGSATNAEWVVDVLVRSSAETID